MKDREEVLVNLADTFMSHLHSNNVEESNNHSSPSESLEVDSRMSERDKLIKEQMKYHKLAKLAQEAIDNDELAINPKWYFKQSGVLMRKWRPRDAPTIKWRPIARDATKGCTYFHPNKGIPEKTSSCLQRWAIILSAYDYEVKYQPTQHGNADGCSRLSIQEEPPNLDD